MNGSAAAAAAFCALILVVPARASETHGSALVTRGWAGYVVRDWDTSFSSVAGTWTQPRVGCSRPGSAVSFWVGLGGARRTSTSLEQIGTSADCDGRASLSTSAWYELYPAPPVDIPIAIRVGDTLKASVTVAATDVLVTLEDVTTGARFAQHVAMPSPAPEADSAEWIAEAPSACLSICAPLPIATFGRIRFVDARATAGEHEGLIEDDAWNAVPVKMRFARPSRLTNGGRTFSVLRAPAD